MNEITVIIPLHKFDEKTSNYLTNAVNSIIENQANYDGKLSIMIIVSKDILQAVSSFSTKYLTNNNLSYSIVSNDAETDFCSQVNYAAKIVNTDFFSILEFDDVYAPKWFKMAKEYYYSHEDVSVFLPINVQCDEKQTMWQFGNEVVWATSFSNELGFIDFDCLENYPSFNLTGGVFNTKDFNTIGGLKSSIKIAFNYEFLLRLTNKKLKAFVIPKEGYKHIVGREGSLTDIYSKTIDNNDVHKWFELAKREYPYAEDRNKGIIQNSGETLK